MPKGKGYSTGGKHEPSGLADAGGPGGQTMDPSMKGAGMGTAYHNINNKNYDPLPGGKGSSGSKSTSKPSK